MKEGATEIIELSLSLDQSGLIWHPEIGDEVTERESLDRVSILVDPQGLTPEELRDNFIWLPNVEQLVGEIESREGLIYHVGVGSDLQYEVVVKSKLGGLVEAKADSIRLAFAKALENLLGNVALGELH